MDIRAKTVVITGAGRGIGRALAIHFAAKGANLALLDTNSTDVDETAAICARERVTVRGYVANVSEEDAVETTFDQVAGDSGCKLRELRQVHGGGAELTGGPSTRQVSPAHLRWRDLAGAVCEEQIATAMRHPR